MMTPDAFVRLVRLPAALTAPGDTLAGAAASGRAFGRHTVLLPLCSTLIYWAAGYIFAALKVISVFMPILIGTPGYKRIGELT